MAEPDFGEHRIEHEGMVLTCRYVAPGLTAHDLTMIFEEAAKGGNSYAGNPGEWPTVRGVMAVRDAIIKAIYGDE